MMCSCNLEKVDPETNATGSSAKFKAIFGGPSNDFPKDILATSDNNYVVVGYSASFGKGNQIFAVKFDKNGVEITRMNYGESGDENAFAIIETSDKGFIMVGYSTSGSGSNKELYVVKTNSQLTEQWKFPYSHFISNEIGIGIIELPNKEYLIAYNDADKLTVGITRINSVGMEISGANKSIRTACNCAARNVILSSDNNLIFTGYKQSNHWIYKTDLNGVKIWEYTLSGLNSIGYSTVEMADKSLYTAGSVTPNANEEFNVVHLSSVGAQIGTTITWGGLQEDKLIGVVKSQDGNIVVTGITDSFGSANQIYLSKRNKDTGAEIWFKNFDEAQWIWDDNYSLSLKSSTDGGSILSAGPAGAQSDFIIYKTDAEGNYK